MRVSTAATLLLICVHVAAAQGEICSPFIETALEEVGSACTELARNTACYGHADLEAEVRADVTSFQFEEVGDQIALGDLQTLKTSALDEENDTWGIAFLSVQANLPDTIPGQNVTLMVYGDATLEPQLPLLLPASAGQTVNIRREPTTASEVVGRLSNTTTLQADGRTEDSEWVRVRLEDGGIGWLNTGVSQVEGDIESLPVIDAEDTSITGGSGTFYFTTGIGSSDCETLPSGGLLVQTPQNTEAELIINDIGITIGSTIAIQPMLVRPNDGPPDDLALVLAFNTFEGSIKQVSIAGHAAFVPPVEAGLALYVPVYEDLGPTGEAPFVAPYTHDLAVLTPLTGILPDPIVPTPPMSEEDFAALSESLLPQEGTWTLSPNQATCIGSGEVFQGIIPEAVEIAVLPVGTTTPPVEEDGAADSSDYTNETLGDLITINGRFVAQRTASGIYHYQDPLLEITITLHSPTEASWHVIQQITELNTANEVIGIHCEDGESNVTAIAS